MKPNSSLSFLWGSWILLKWWVLWFLFQIPGTCSSLILKFFKTKTSSYYYLPNTGENSKAGAYLSKENLWPKKWLWCVQYKLGEGRSSEALSRADWNGFFSLCCCPKFVGSPEQGFHSHFVSNFRGTWLKTLGLFSLLSSSLPPTQLLAENLGLPPSPVVLIALPQKQIHNHPTPKNSHSH